MPRHNSYHTQRRLQEKRQEDQSSCLAPCESRGRRQASGGSALEQQTPACAHIERWHYKLAHTDLLPARHHAAARFNRPVFRQHLQAHRGTASRAELHDRHLGATLRICRSRREANDHSTGTIDNCSSGGATRDIRLAPSSHPRNSRLRSASTFFSSIHCDPSLSSRHSGAGQARSASGAPVSMALNLRYRQK